MDFPRAYYLDFPSPARFPHMPETETLKLAAVLYALDARTGKTLYNSGYAISSWFTSAVG